MMAAGWEPGMGGEEYAGILKKLQTGEGLAGTVKNFVRDHAGRSGAGPMMTAVTLASMLSRSGVPTSIAQAEAYLRGGSFNADTGDLAGVGTTVLSGAATAKTTADFGTSREDAAAAQERIKAGGSDATRVLVRSLETLHVAFAKGAANLASDFLKATGALSAFSATIDNINERLKTVRTTPGATILPIMPGQSTAANIPNEIP